MRLLIDEHKFSWDEAFEVTCQVFSYTNHTLMSEALETWPVDMLGKILPRHLQIIFEINDYFLKTLQEQYPNDTDLLSRTSIIDESNGRRVRMAWLAGSGQPQGQRGVRAAFPTDGGVTVCRIRQNLPNALYQRDQRCDAAPLAGAGPTRRCRKCWMSISAAPGGPI
ncbi:glycogen phosphorylase [Klebsiella pneumoniae]|uniref:Alpha-1,4 glucan phosphorylase n=1 Tax=Klebsiella pneumoniae TaxID=573 RepID=A0A4P0YHR6_KLEPN|nr:glycogen phosphorylase [Klebsiella pneumoniae]